MTRVPSHPLDLTAQLVAEGVLTRNSRISTLDCTTLPAHADCRRPQFCGGASQLALCLECRGEEGEVAA